MVFHKYIHQNYFLVKKKLQFNLEMRMAYSTIIKDINHPNDLMEMVKYSRIIKSLPEHRTLLDEGIKYLQNKGFSNKTIRVLQRKNEINKLFIFMLILQNADKNSIHQRKLQ